MDNPSALNAWQGARYNECGRILLLLESTYGAPGRTQAQDVREWTRGGADATFSRLHRVLSAPGESRLAFFDRFACMNLVQEPIAESNDVKVKDHQLLKAAVELPARLNALQPHVVWIASKRAAPFARIFVKLFGARVVETAHPLYAADISDHQLRQAFADVFELANAHKFWLKTEGTPWTYSRYTS